jgi:hypothetical protein
MKEAIYWHFFVGIQLQILPTNGGQCPLADEISQNLLTNSKLADLCQKKCTPSTL